MRRSIVSVLLLLALVAVPSISEATTSVTISIDGTDVRSLTATTALDGTPLPILIAGRYKHPTNNHEFVILRCASNVGGVSRPCSGSPSAILVDKQGSYSEVTVTDAAIARLDSNPGNSFLTLKFSSDDFKSIRSGTYDYYIHQDGSIVGDTFLNTLRNDKFEASGFFDGSLGQCSIITDGPVLSVAVAQTTATAQINTGSKGFPCCQGPYSMFEPYADYTTNSATSTIVLTHHAEPVKGCCDDGEGSCENVLDGEVRITLAPRNATAAIPHRLNLPGSFGVGVVNVLADEGGDQILARRLASLQRGDEKAIALRACLAPSPGETTGDAGLLIRNVRNSERTWLSPGCNFGGNDSVPGAGETQVEITSGGSVRVTAHGLCPVDGCVEEKLDISLFCGGDNPDPTTPVVDYVNALEVDRNGNGAAVVAAAVPCFDPAVLIREHGGTRRWVAASGVH
ncbi:MAG: hypothetical protein E6J87_11280 [Deltaproteobacteria bacterium]|nr:MAG: hypothetical protein E6J87_11280 [Deltaproteobacteria bacterium]